MRVALGEQSLECGWREVRVIECKSDAIASGQQVALVLRHCREPDVSSVANNTDARVAQHRLRDDASRRVGAGVVHDQQLKLAQGLVEDGIYGRAEKSAVAATKVGSMTETRGEGPDRPAPSVRVLPAISSRTFT